MAQVNSQCHHNHYHNNLQYFSVARHSPHHAHPMFARVCVVTSTTVVVIITVLLALTNLTVLVEAVPARPHSTLPVNYNKPLSGYTTRTSSDVIYYWNKEKYPHPLEEPQYCHRHEPSLLCDPDDLLTREQGNIVSNLLIQLQNSTRCFCAICPRYNAVSPTGGLKVAVALARNIYKSYNLPASESSNTQDFANYLRIRWDFGLCDDSVLILIVLGRHEIGISLGTVAEKVLPERDLQSIITGSKDLFGQNRIFETLQRILEKIHHTVEKRFEFAPPDVATSRLANSKIADNIDEPQGRTAIVVVALIVGFLLIVSLLIGSMMLLKQHYEKADDGSDENRPSGYWDDPEVKTLERKLSGKSSPRPTTKVSADYEPCSIIEEEEEEENQQLAHTNGNGVKPQTETPKL